MIMNQYEKFSKLIARLGDEAKKEFSYELFNINGVMKGRGIGAATDQQLAEIATGLVKKYGEASSALSAELYDRIAYLSKAKVPPAIPAEPAGYEEVARAISAVTSISDNENMLTNVVSRLVKMAASDTTLRNAIRDSAEVAWVPHGDTCAFCLTLASRGWERASMSQVENGHAMHIHANCDCEYAVRFNGFTSVKGYDPEYYSKLYYSQPGNSKEKMNSIRRMVYQENREHILEQKREAYHLAKEAEGEKSNNSKETERQ